MVSEPSLDGRDLPVRQQRQDLTPLEIADDRPVSMIASECPVVHADDARRLGWPAGAPSHDPQQGVIADRKHQPFGEARAWPAAERKPEMVDDALQAHRSPGS